jgi:hypothetical protein
VTMRFLIAAGTAVALVLPASSAADETSPADHRNASKECKAERGTTDGTRQAFADKYGTNANDSNAFGKCASQKAKEEHSERHAAKRAAKKQCKAQGLRGQALGRCMSKAAKKHKAAADKQDKTEAAKQQNAAKKCAAEREAGPEAFALKYGTNRNKKNAFGKCVSKTARSS